MRRAANNGGDSRALDNALETITAAATAIASAENRVPQATATPKRRWWSRWSIYWCFGSPQHRKRIGHSVLVPEQMAPSTSSPAPGYPARASVIAFPFIAPPSSPASVLQSEPLSATQSPASLVSVSLMPTGMYSPCGRPSIFAIGPYAHETQLVSPPVFSTFTTEPSTAPFTPPPESVHLTTPSSPEVPFAQLFNPDFQNGKVSQRCPMSENYEFQFYQLPPGSPLGRLISPSSGFSHSGTASPFPDGEIAIGSPKFPQFQIGDAQKLLSPDKLCNIGQRSYQGSGTFTPESVSSTPRNGVSYDHQAAGTRLNPHSDIGYNNAQICVDHRVLFDLNAEDVVRRVENKFKTFCEAVSIFPQAESTGERPVIPNQEVESCEYSRELPNKTSEKFLEEEKEAMKHNKRPSISLGSIREFNFHDMEGTDSDKRTIGSDSGADEKIVAMDNVGSKNWSFFPVMQPGVS